MDSSPSFLVLFLLTITFFLVTAEEPCDSAIDISNPKRAPNTVNSQTAVELCDSDLQEGKWYYLGGEITGGCVDFNRCSTFSGIWYQGNYPSGNEIVSGKVCAKVDPSGCCGWSDTIQVKKCPKGYVYQLAIPKECPMSYCVGEANPCPAEQVYNKNAGTCLAIPQLQQPVLSDPYISAYKMYGAFNATMFSIDCKLNSNPIKDVVNAKLKVEVVFKMNQFEVAKFVSDYPVNKVTLEESYLVGHIGKTLTVEAQLYYEFNDGSFSTKTSVVRSSGYYFGIEAVDSKGIVLKEIVMQQGVTKEIYLKSTFPITFGHCVKSDKCLVQKYSFVTAAMKIGVTRNECQVQFENPFGLLVYKSSNTIRISAQITPGIENSKDVLAFKPYSHVFTGTIFQGYLIAPIQIIVTETIKQPTCHSVGDPHFLSFHGITFDNYNSGDFNLLSTRERTFQIQVRQIFCYGRVSCNCGVIAREGNNLIGINSCDYRKTPTVIQLMRDNVNPTASLKIVNGEYYIKFVSGVSIKVSLFYDSGKSATYMNIYVNGLKHELYGGICSATTKPADFNVYRIPYAESFFKSQLPPCVNEVFTFPICKCVTDQTDAVSVVCDFDQSQQDTKLVKFENICDVKNGRQKRSTGSGPALLGQAKTSTQGLTLEDVFKSLDRSRDNETSKEVVLIPLAEAQGHCSKVLEKSHFSNECKAFLGNKHESIKESCVADVKLSGSAAIAETYLNVYEEVCMTTLAKEVTIVDGEKSPESKAITDVLEEMKTAFNERQRNSSKPWEEETKPTTKNYSEIQELLKKLKPSHVLIFSGTILVAGTVVTKLLS